MKKSIIFSFTALSIAACNSQGEKRSKTTKAEPAKKEQQSAPADQPLTKNITPAQPAEPKIPEMEKTIQFVPPVVTDEPDREPDLRASSTSYGSDREFGEIDAVPPPPPPPAPSQPLQVIEESAEFPGGKAALNKYLADNLQYPQSAIDAGIEGKAYIKFIVGADGSLRDVKVVKKVPDCPECDKEALRLVKAMPKWTPGKDKGKNVDSYFNLPVPFRLQ